ncbi:LLM class flavin-dependent oxidoreductase [Sandaracinobacter sp. RS1-74]|uniref:LLM class flavin-dependent oxidoreductase n=1 Tax=Sandaracinobacteroides sayramensis TaxID=2913411 RepID=UPI001EDC1DB4|nr:LLM class flavin-dependent oxidoreductase [Sandaracinobacteroides sayramensis]MCG2842446.1 LLM class flavin-dependent oxidoreductase [Sandaracinobacteroides sayramensis]
MPAADGKLRLGAFIQGVGHHLASWAHPSVDPAQLFRLEHYQQVACTAERAKFDALFFADNVGLLAGLHPLAEKSALVYHFEPLTLLGALIPVTRHIGLVATVSATYLAPYHAARKFASLDNLSGGRAGWNLVTSGTDVEARNFGLKEQLGHAHRYERAAEYVEVVRKLWDSFDDDAILLDQQNQRFFDTRKVQPVAHHGTYFDVAGPAQWARSVQGHPVLVQAGSSADGQALAAETADVVFTAQQLKPDAIAFAQGLKDQAEALGRRRDDVLVMPGITAYVAPTEAEARERYEELQALVDPRVGVGLLSAMIGWDLSGADLDGPLPEAPKTQGWQSRQQLFADIARADNLTVRQLVGRITAARGHWVVVGNATQVADQIEDWFRAGAADGFNVLPPTLPGGLEDFADLVTPELQRRGLFRTDYEGRTLRDHLGLARPAVTRAPTRQRRSEAV